MSRIIGITSFVLLIFGCGWVWPASPGAAASAGSNPGAMDFRGNYDFISFVYNLMSDALDLLPDDLENLVLKGQKVDSLLAGALAFDPWEKGLKFSIEPSNLGAHAAYIVLQIYGEVPINVVIPQAVYYSGFEKSEDVSGRISDAKRLMEKSTHTDRDRYNLTLSILTDLWLLDIEKSGQKIKDPPKEGVYLRDRDDELYLVEGAEK